MKSGEKVCPRCAEAVKLNAQVCKHCGYEFTAEDSEAIRIERQKGTRQGFFGCLGCGGLLVVLAVIVAAVDRGAESNTTDASTNSIGAVASAPVSDATKQSFVYLYQDVLAAVKPCDKAFDRLGQAAKTGAPLATYKAAKVGADACQEAATTIGKKSAPSQLSGAAAEKTEEALKVCRNAYVARQMGFEKAMAIADGDTRPSVMSDMEENMKQGQAGVLLCVGSLIEASGLVGVDPKTLH
jgi:hypothetical protein